jgi:hypothetical protein
MAHEKEKRHFPQLLTDSERMVGALDGVQEGGPVSIWFEAQEKIKIDKHHTAIKAGDGRFICWKNGRNWFRSCVSAKSYLNSEHAREEEIKLEEESEQAMREYHNRPGGSCLIDD